MNIRDEARAEAGRQMLEARGWFRSTVREEMRFIEDFIAGAVWASEQPDRETSERHDSTDTGSVAPPSEGSFCDQCAGPYPLDSWPGSQYAGHWDTCPNRHSAEPAAKPSDAEVEAAAMALWDARRDHSEDPPWGHRELHTKFEEAYRAEARAALLAAQEVRVDS